MSLRDSCRYVQRFCVRLGSKRSNQRGGVLVETHFQSSAHYTSMSGRKRTRAEKRLGVDSASVDEANTASLTADLLMRGRSRARELVEPAIAEAARASGRVTDLRSLLAAGSRRDVALALIWAAIFIGCFLLVRWSDS